MHNALVFAAACAGGLLWWQRRARRLDDWRDSARDAALPFRDLGPAGIEVEVPGATMPVRIERQDRATRLWTTYPVPAGPAFCAIPRHRFGGPGCELEARFGPPVTIAVPQEFFAHHTLLARDLPRANQVLACGRQILVGLLSGALREATLSSHRCVVELVIPDPQPQGKTAVATLRGLTETVAADIFGLGILRSLPGARALHSPPDLEDPQLPQFRVEGWHGCVFWTECDGDELSTRVRLTRSVRGAPFRAHLASGGHIDGSLPRGSIAIELIPLLARVGTCELDSDGTEVVLRWPTLIVDREILEAGARLLGALCGGGE